VQCAVIHSLGHVLKSIADNVHSAQCGDGVVSQTTVHEWTEVLQKWPKNCQWHTRNAVSFHLNEMMVTLNNFAGLIISWRGRVSISHCAIGHVLKKGAEYVAWRPAENISF
jgi:hypothetical protein